MNNSIRIPLPPDVQVLELPKTEQGDWLIKIESTLPGPTCHQCGREITDLHCHNQSFWIRRLPLFEFPGENFSCFSTKTLRRSF